MKTIYTYAKDAKNLARAMGSDLSISTKQAIEICSYLRGKSLQKAQRILQDAKNEFRAIPFTRFSEGAGHKPGMGMGKYPVKASTQLLKLLDVVEANAQQLGLSSDLTIVHMVANRAARPMHNGRKRGREMKRTHVEIIVQEKQGKKRASTKNIVKAPVKRAPVVKAAAPKKEVKPTEEKKAIVKKVAPKKEAKSEAKE